LNKNLEAPSLSGRFNFIAYPSIFKNNFIDLSDLLFEIRAFYVAHDILKQHESIIRSCDHTIIDEFKNFSDQMVELLILGMSSEHKLDFRSDTSSTDILDTLNTGIIDLKNIRENEKLLVMLCDERLTPVQQKLFEMSLQ
jgi:hypothetical protein